MFLAILRTLISALQSRPALAIENLALRHQLLVLQRNARQPRLRRMDRILWVLLSRLWIGFFTVPTATFRVLFVFLILSNDRRRVVHFNVTATPSAAWTGQQIVEAFPWDSAPRFLPRDRDGIYGAEFDRRVDSMGVEQVPTSPRSPGQSSYVERLIGSIRRECLDHVIVFNERHLRRALTGYFEHYHGLRTRLGLEKDCPVPRGMEPAELGVVCSQPMVGGLHHRYFRRAA